MKEKMDIVATRCRLFEKERNDKAYKALSPVPSNVSSEPSSSPPASSVSPLSPCTHNQISSAPQTSNSSAIESLINLEILKAVKASAPSAATPQDNSHNNLGFSSSDLLKIIESLKSASNSGAKQNPSFSASKLATQLTAI